MYEGVEFENKNVWAKQIWVVTLGIGVYISL